MLPLGPVVMLAVRLVDALCDDVLGSVAAELGSKEEGRIPKPAVVRMLRSLLALLLALVLALALTLPLVLPMLPAFSSSFLTMVVVEGSMQKLSPNDMPVLLLLFLSCCRPNCDCDWKYNCTSTLVDCSLSLSRWYAQ